MGIRLNTSSKSRTFQGDGIALEDKDILPEGVHTVKFVKFTEFSQSDGTKSPINTWTNAAGVTNSKIRACFRAIGVKQNINPFCFFDVTFTEAFVTTFVVSMIQAATLDELDDVEINTIEELKDILETVLKDEELRVRTGTETFARKDNTVGKTAIVTSFFSKRA